MPPATSLKTCPGCRATHQIRIGSKDELKFLRVIPLEHSQKEFYCGVNCYQKYIIRTLGEQNRLDDQELERLRNILHTRKQPEFAPEPEDADQFPPYTTKRRSSHNNTKTSALTTF